MAKYNTSTVKPAVKSVIKDKVSTKGKAVTHQGGTGASVRTAKGELYLLVVSSFMENTFYEGADATYARLRDLTHKIAVKDPVWIAGLTKWVRDEGNLRSVSIALALETAHALLKAGIPGGRAVVRSAIKRADEPGEALAYWQSTYGGSVPKPIKRGIADAASDLYNEYSLGKYDSKNAHFRFGDVIAVTHPAPVDEVQSDLFTYARAVRRDSTAVIPESLGILSGKKAALSDGNIKDIVARGTDAIKAAGLTWENISSALGGMDAKAWEVTIPTMGYMALLRNLRNFNNAGISVAARKKVAARLSDPEQVARSKQFPFRFLSAMKANESNSNYTTALSDALDASLSNVPSLKGRTLILVDCSGSMTWATSKHSNASYMVSAATFGSALALAADNATLVAFGSSSSVIPFNKGDSVLNLVGKFKVMGGTNTADAVSTHFRDHDRVIIITDEQYQRGNPTSIVPADVPVYTWNLVGYSAGHGNGNNRYTFGGLTDASFRTISLLEGGKNDKWPWED